VPKPYLFVSLGLALSEKQNPQVVEKIEKPKEQMEGLELSVVLRRQTLYPTELRARGRSHSDSKAFATVTKIKSSPFTHYCVRTVPKPSLAGKFWHSVPVISLA
jgi:hypothetical protein